MYHNYLNRDIPDRARNEFVFGTSTRNLKKRGILKENELPKKLRASPKPYKDGQYKFELTYHFIIEDNAEEHTEVN